MYMYNYVLLTKHEVKMAGYWPCSFFFFAFLWTSTLYRSIKMQKKKELGQYPATLTKQAKG